MHITPFWLFLIMIRCCHCQLQSSYQFYICILFMNNIVGIFGFWRSPACGTPKPSRWPEAPVTWFRFCSPTFWCPAFTIKRRSISLRSVSTHLSFRCYADISTICYQILDLQITMYMVTSTSMYNHKNIHTNVINPEELLIITSIILFFTIFQMVQPNLFQYQ